MVYRVGQALDVLLQAGESAAYNAYFPVQLYALECTANTIKYPQGIEFVKTGRAYFWASMAPTLMQADPVQMRVNVELNHV